MIGLNKIFRIQAKIAKSNDTTIELNKRYTQANQSFDINVISSELIKMLRLEQHSLAKIDFKRLFMRIANHREIVLHY